MSSSSPVAKPKRSRKDRPRKIQARKTICETFGESVRDLSVTPRQALSQSVEGSIAEAPPKDKATRGTTKKSQGASSDQIDLELAASFDVSQWEPDHAAYFSANLQSCLKSGSNLASLRKQYDIWSAIYRKRHADAKANPDSVPKSIGCVKCRPSRRCMFDAVDDDWTVKTGCMECSLQPVFKRQLTKSQLIHLFDENIEFDQTKFRKWNIRDNIWSMIDAARSHHLKTFPTADPKTALTIGVDAARVLFQGGLCPCRQATCICIGDIVRAYGDDPGYSTDPEKEPSVRDLIDKASATPKRAKQLLDKLSARSKMHARLLAYRKGGKAMDDPLKRLLVEKGTVPTNPSKLFEKAFLVLGHMTSKKSDAAATEADQEDIDPSDDPMSELVSLLME